jgi:Membrane dipeptidase (Peptidase family M19)
MILGWVSSSLPGIDGHNDLSYLIRHHANGNVADYDLFRRTKKRDTDLPRLREGRVSAQVFAAFVPPREPKPASFALMQITPIRRMNALHLDALMPGSRSSDISPPDAPHDHGWRGPGVNGPRALILAARYAPGMGRTGMISTDSPGKIAKCGWFSNSFAAASCESARTTV